MYLVMYMYIQVCREEPQCCEMQEGLCTWTGWIQEPYSGDCDYYGNVECNGIHPDDLEWLREKYDEDRLEDKRRKFMTVCLDQYTVGPTVGPTIVHTIVSSGLCIVGKRLQINKYPACITTHYVSVFILRMRQ